MRATAKKILLKNWERHEIAEFSRNAGVVRYCKPQKKTVGFYFKQNENFLALYFAEDINEVVMFFKGDEYRLHDKLDISWHKHGKDRIFKVANYNIEIHYKESEFLDMDVWSTEIDVDLLFKIFSHYKDGNRICDWLKRISEL